MSSALVSPAPLVVCVVLNTNRKDDTLECLASLSALAYRNVQALVLDCQSSDGSVEAIRSAYPEVGLLRLAENRGYAGNNNVGIRVALEMGAQWVFVLNEDVVLDPQCLSRLIDAAAGHPDVGILGPTVYHHDEPTCIQSAGGGLTRRWEAFHFCQNETDTGQLGAPRAVQWISGCAILVSRAVINAVGVIDERFFIYWEETEWCVRAARDGWRIVHVPTAKTWHKGVQRQYRPTPSVIYYMTRNRLLLLSIHRAPWSAWLAAWSQTLRTLTSWTVRPKWRDKAPHRDAMWHGLVDFIQRRWGQMTT